MDKYVVSGIMETCSKPIGKNNLHDQLIVANDMAIYYDKYKMLRDYVELELKDKIVAFLPYDKINELYCIETQVTMEMK